MRVERHQNIAGVPAIKMRDAFKRLFGGHWGLEFLAATLDLPEAEATKVKDELLALGYIERSEGVLGEEEFGLTISGGALARASAMKPLKRATAERLVKELLARAAEINADTNMPFMITKLTAFGSYITEQDLLGDIDLALELAARIDDEQEHRKAVAEHLRRAKASGQIFRSFLDELFCAKNELRARLKGSSKYISLHEHAELEELGVTGVDLLPAPRAAS